MALPKGIYPSSIKNSVSIEKEAPFIDGDTKEERHTRRKRKTRQHGGTQPTDETIREQVHKYFPEFKDTIRVNQGHVFLTCPGSLANNKFIHFHIAFPKMILNDLRRCSEISGTDILKRIIMIGQALSLHTIELHDASRIGCNFPLSTLSILQHGETWYHRMGFRSPTYAKDREFNEALRQEKWEDFVHEMLNMHTPEIERVSIEKHFKTYLKQWYRAFPNTKGHTVADVIRMLPWKTIECGTLHATLLRDFLDKADIMLAYDSTVTLDLRSHN